VIALSIATALNVLGSVGIPSWHGLLVDPCKQAVVSGALMTVILWVALFRGPRGVALERMASFLFLAGMPLIYIARWVLTGGAGTGSLALAVEIAGLPIYAGLAILGLRRSPWFMAIGIMLHGIVWDAAHLLFEVPYIPTWYAIGCLLADVAVGGYLATRVATWRLHSPQATRLVYAS
jgi:hypothetical protein